ncbi:hypothetical protein [Aestuariimicrobium kwangyangense]|uniref:hypothetical protein n=1 Tax=Aestuariimicrobium kwangyangense TaxID=396389 RepID=UPI0003B34BEE|nr:hypothetical protein [Aestuariimicrobium kwangyangense]
MSLDVVPAGHRAQVGLVPVTATLIGTIALHTAVPPFATDMYTPRVASFTLLTRRTSNHDQ